MIENLRVFERNTKHCLSKHVSNVSNRKRIIEKGHFKQKLKIIQISDYRFQVRHRDDQILARTVTHSTKVTRVQLCIGKIFFSLTLICSFQLKTRRSCARWRFIICNVSQTSFNYAPKTWKIISYNLPHQLIDRLRNRHPNSQIFQRNTTIFNISSKYHALKIV